MIRHWIKKNPKKLSLGWGYFTLSLNDFGKVMQESKAESSFMFWLREHQFSVGGTPWGTQELREVPLCGIIS